MMHGMPPRGGTPHEGPPYEGGGYAPPPGGGRPPGGGGYGRAGYSGGSGGGGEEGNPDVVDADGVRGVDRARMKLVPWLAKIADSIEQESPLQVTLCQVAVGSGQQEVTTTLLDPDGSVQDTVDQLLDAAVQDMQEAHFSGNGVSYALVVTLQNGKSERYTFILTVPRRRVLDDPPRSPYFPDAAGQTRFWMDQNLQLTEFALESASAGKDVLLQMIQDLRAENHRLKRHQFERDHQIQILIDGNMKRQMMVDEHKSKLESSQKMIDTFKSFVPMLLGLALPPHLSANLKGFMTPPDDGEGASAAMMGPGRAQAPSNEADVIDELIMELESDQAFFMKLFNLMSEKPRCFELLGMLHTNSAARRESRARAQADESARRQQETLGGPQAA